MVSLVYALLCLKRAVLLRLHARFERSPCPSSSSLFDRADFFRVVQYLSEELKVRVLLFEPAGSACSAPDGISIRGHNREDSTTTPMFLPPQAQLSVRSARHSRKVLFDQSCSAVPLLQKLVLFSDWLSSPTLSDALTAELFCRICPSRSMAWQIWKTYAHLLRSSRWDHRFYLLSSINDV